VQKGLAKRFFITSRAVICLVGLSLGLTAAPAAVTTGSTSQCNIICSPFPATAASPILARLSKKPMIPPPVLVAKKVKPSVLISVAEPAEQKPTNPMQRAVTSNTSPALVKAVIGSEQTNDNHAQVRIGYGKMLADNSSTVGHKNGTRLEEPGCLYVKTSVNF
jgi:hypothetical protein